MALDTIPKQEGGKLKAVASGTLPSGKPVIVNADGTVSVVAETDLVQAVGTPVVFESANIEGPAVGYASADGKFVIAYTDRGNSNRGTAVVGTVSGSSISFGTPVVFEDGGAEFSSVTYDAGQDKILISYVDTENSDYGKAVVGTVSGTSISFGTIVVFESSSTDWVSSVYDSSSQKVVITFEAVVGGNPSINAIVGTISGTSISFGSASVIETSGRMGSVAYHAGEQKVVVGYQISSNGDGKAAVGTVSGTSISFGTPVIVDDTGTTSDFSLVYDASNEKIVVIYRIGVEGEAVVGTVSGTSISFGTSVTFGTSADDLSASYDSLAGKVSVAYRDYSNSSYGTVVAGTVSGTSISFGTALVFESATTDWIGSAYGVGSKRTVIAYGDDGNLGYGTSVTFGNAYTSTNLTSENYIGISTGGAVADGGNATVGIVGSVSDEQTGLTSGQSYYVQRDGTVGTTPADPSVLAGTAISATKMLVKT